MTKILRTSLVLAALTLGAFSGTAHAQGRGGNFGLGGMVGDPAGLTMKLRTNSGFAVQIDFGWSAWGYNRNWNGSAMQLSADFLWAIDLKSLRRTDMSFYFGVGPQLEFDTWSGGNPHANVFFGPRVPLGMDWEFKSRPLDVFFEFAPGFVFGDGWDADTNPDLFFEVDFSAGARYWF